MYYVVTTVGTYRPKLAYVRKRWDGFFGLKTTTRAQAKTWKTRAGAVRWLKQHPEFPGHIHQL